MAHTVDDNGDYSLDFTTLSAGINGELALEFIFLQSGYTNSAYIVLTDQIFGDQYDGAIALDLPAGTDANGNGFPDFFESSQAVNGPVTSGAYNLQSFGSGTVTAQWGRDTNSASGTCVLQLNGIFPTPTFFIPFELLEYAGPLTYTAGSNAVAGSVDLTQTGNSANEWIGSVQFVKNTTNRFNSLNLQVTNWTNSAAQTLSVSNHVFSRDLVRQTNYSGYLEFWDGDPSGPDPDYWLWRLAISDSNDANHNGIPDFSDDPVLPRAPSLSVTPTPTNVLLTIQGDIGHLHQVKEATSVTTTNWPTVLSVTLTNDPQVVTLPLPTSSTRFWRVLAQ
jgi:hypothetical protein